MTSPIIDLYFPLQGRNIPVDHGYPLFAALAQRLETPGHPWLHESGDIGIHLIRGRYQGQGLLALGPHAKLGLRLPAERLPQLLPLAGKALEIAGHGLRLGIPQPHALQPAANLYAHLVTTHHGQDEARFDQEIARQLAALGIQSHAQRGPRRTFAVKGKQVVAHSLLVTELTAEESIRLQEMGLGGRRKLGCGVFVPWIR
ncbi:MAG: type I-MYXAN CRISPR-associated protein Cas6/Cmx6 [Methylococcaceae bacterium]|nr:MAG: type I-MYXAN CRISPR-associated protein Cas6/Cmx6 [Methylococcaceae bacterium]